MRWNFWKRPPLTGLTILFRSGARITLHDVTDWSVTGSGEGVRRLTLTQTSKTFQLIGQSISVDQIDAIVEHV